MYLYAEIYQPTAATVARFDDGFLIASTRYYHSDQLSTRFTTDSTQYYSAHMGQYPFGEIWYDDGSTTTKTKFTTYERDAESGNDYALARAFVNRLGRFSSPDPLGGSIADPQSLNRYAYTRNDPVDRSDQSGRSDNKDCGDFGCADSGGDEGGGLDSGFTFMGGDNPVGVDGGSGPGMVLGGDFADTTVTVTANSSPDEVMTWSFYTGQIDIFNRTVTNLPIANILLNVQNLLSTDLNCAKILNSMGGNASQLVSSVLQNGLFNTAALPITLDSQGNLTSITNAVSGPVGTDINGAALTVNPFGAFFSGNFLGTPITTDNGRIPGGTGRARVFIALHELGHQTGVLEHDAGDSDAGRRNDSKIDSNCKKGLKTVKQ